jgi:tRNA-dihydrouridine synthase
VTHAGFRTLVSEHGGCDLYWTEMTSAEALLGQARFESYYLNLEPTPERTVFQLVGYSKDAILHAARLVAETPACGIDLNFACSAPHIVRKGGGIAWFSREREAASLVEAVRAVIGDKTLSVKLRLGRSPGDDLHGFCRTMQSAGVDFVTLHPKLQREGPARRARWSEVADLRSVLQVPVIGSGGVDGWDSLEQRIRAGGPGPMMIGRGAVRAPWIFAYLAERFANPDYRHHVDLRDVLSKFHQLLELHQPTEFLATRARRFYPYFFSNLPFAHSIGARLGQSDSYEDGKREAAAYLDAHPKESQLMESR